MRQLLFATYVISLSLMTVLMSLLQPTPSATAQQLIGPVHQGTSTQGRRIEKKDVQPSIHNPHRLIRKPQNAPVASVEPSPVGSSLLRSLPPPLQGDNATSQPNEPSSLHRSVGATVPLATMSVAPPSATTTGSAAAGTASTGTIPLAAAGAGNSSTSGNGNAGGRSMSRLAAEMPGLAQLTSPPASVPPAPTNPVIGASPTTLSFTVQQGGSNPSAQTLSIINTGGGTLTWSASDDANWLTATPASGTGNGTMTVSVVTGTLTAATYNGTITLTATGAANRTVPVTFTVTAAPNISLSPSSLTYTATQGGANPANQMVTLTTTGGTLNWTTTDNVNWLAVSPASGNGNGTLTASVNTAGLAAGTHTGTITVSATGTASRTVAVTLTVNAPTTSSATLTWTANTESDLAGYRVYRATASGAYGAPVATLQGNVTTYTATGLQSPATYFFVITAYDSAGNESVRSSEVSKSIF